MRRIVLILLGTVLALALQAGPASAATTAVKITATAFAPATVYVSDGDTVTWTNSTTTSQQVVADNGSFSSPVLAAGQSYSHTFGNAGSFAYHNGLHPAVKGSLNVLAHGQATILNSGFQPPSVAVTAGETVTWTNRGTANHQVVSDDGSFTSPVLAPGQTYQHSFDSAGTFNYHDGLSATHKGSVIVAAAPAPVNVTFSASRTSLINGGTVTLSGTVSTGNAGQTVSIVVAPTGSPSHTITVTTVSGGRFSVSVAPRIGTTYRAEVKTSQGGTSTSDDVRVLVRPRVSLRHVGSTRWSASVLAARPLNGRVIALLEWMARKRAWVTVRRSVLRPYTSTVSVASFSIRLRHGLKLRAVVASPGSGYIAGYSNFVVS